MTTGSSDIDLVTEYLISVNRENKGDLKLKKAIEAHNEFKEKFTKYKNFYDDHRQREELQDTPTSQDAPKSHEKLRAEIKKLNFEKDNMRKQIEELRTRLSTLAGHKMMDGNPDIADLSDPFRPTKLAEEFREIYDDDWTHAFEELDTNSKPESDNIDTLTNLIKEIQTFCTYSSSQQIIAMEKVCKDELVNPKVHILKHSEIMCGKTPSEMNNTQLETTHRMICDMRKSMGTLSVRPLVQIFHEKWVIRMKLEKKLPSTSKHIENFVAKAFEVIWLMTIQNPPMVFKWQKRDEPVDKERFTFYTKRGNTIQQTVWPAVLLHESGPLMSKGIVQAQ